MSWGDFAATDYAADKAARTGRGAYLVERDKLLGERPFEIAFVEVSTLVASWQTAFSFSIPTPDYVLAGWYLHAHVEVKVAAGTGGMIRLINSTDAIDGTAQTGISATAYEFSNDLSVRVDAGPLTTVAFVVQIQGDGTNLMYARTRSLTATYSTFWWSAT